MAIAVRLGPIVKSALARSLRNLLGGRFAALQPPPCGPFGFIVRSEGTWQMWRPAALNVHSVILIVFWVRAVRSISPLVLLLLFLFELYQLKTVLPLARVPSLHGMSSVGGILRGDVRLGRGSVHEVARTVRLD